ncbi:hypothetical protein QYF36_018032 [Acer negundo]|nr:hypothetical protein QYF36_018032 [Acer negundo]
MLLWTCGLKRKLKEADNSTKQQDVGSSISVVLDQAVHKKKDDDGDLHQALSGSINTSFLKEISFQAIDDAEDEWGQHNAKKLIDTSVKGLRGSIPKDFPYFHVEFGLDKGFVNVIDDEKQFKSSFGLKCHERHATATRGGHAPPSETPSLWRHKSWQ